MANWACRRYPRRFGLALYICLCIITADLKACFATSHHPQAYFSTFQRAQTNVWTCELSLEPKRVATFQCLFAASRGDVDRPRIFLSRLYSLHLKTRKQRTTSRKAARTACHFLCARASMTRDSLVTMPKAAVCFQRLNIPFEGYQREKLGYCGVYSSPCTGYRTTDTLP